MAGTGWDPAGVDTEVTISPDGQTATRSGDSTYSAVRGLAGRSRGRRYFEITPSAATFASYCAAGFMSAGASLTQELGIGTPIAGGWMPEQGVFKYSYVSGAGMREDQDSVSAGVLGVLIDFDTKVCTIYRNGAIDWVEVMDIPNDTILFPAVSLYHDNAVTLQTVEPFQYPPEVTFMAWDIPDSSIISKIFGLLTIEGNPARRMLKAFSFERLTFQLDGNLITESKPLGQTVSDEDGQYQIILREGFPREVFVVAFDDYGEVFQPSIAVSLGDRIHPTQPNGYVYECDGAGVLPAVEPAWSTDTGSSQLVGTASFSAAPFYRPEVHGPLLPIIAEVIFTPSDIPTVLWLDAADASTIGLISDRVSQWSDKSGFFRHAMQTASGSRPTPNTVENSITFDSDDFMTLASNGNAIFQNVGVAWVFAVFKRDVADPAGGVVRPIFLASVGTSGNYRVGMVIGGSAYASNELSFGGRRLDNDSYESVGSGFSVVGDWVMAFGQIDYTGRKIELHINGERVSQKTDAFTASGNTPDTPSTRVRVAANGSISPTDLFNGHQREVVAGAIKMDQEDIDRMFGYAAWKYGLAGNLPPDHPYKNFRP